MRSQTKGSKTYLVTWAGFGRDKDSFVLDKTVEHFPLALAKFEARSNNLQFADAMADAMPTAGGDYDRMVLQQSLILHRISLRPVHGGASRRQSLEGVSVSCYRRAAVRAVRQTRRGVISSHPLDVRRLAASRPHVDPLFQEKQTAGRGFYCRLRSVHPRKGILIPQILACLSSSNIFALAPFFLPPQAFSHQRRWAQGAQKEGRS